MSAGRFEGQVAIVTGAAQGLGYATAELLAREGATVVLSDINEEKLAAAVAGLAEDGLAVSGGPADLTQPDHVERVVAAAIADCGQIDILVNLAAISPIIPFDDLTLEDFHRVIAASVDSTFLTCKAAVPHMRKRGYGRIINTTTGSLEAPIAGTNAYVTSKGAILGFSRQLSREVGEHGITVNIITPGVIATDNLLTVFGGRSQLDEFFEHIVAKQSVKRRGEPCDVAHGIAYLASREAGFVSGHALAVGGGEFFL